MSLSLSGQILLIYSAVSFPYMSCISHTGNSQKLYLITTFDILNFVDVLKLLYGCVCEWVSL